MGGCGCCVIRGNAVYDIVRALVTFLFVVPCFVYVCLCVCFVIVLSVCVGVS